MGSSFGAGESQLVHELKNPLTGIKLGLNNIKTLLKQKGLSDKDIEDILSQSEENIDVLKNHLTNFLDFSKKEELNLTDTDLNTVIQKAHFFVAEQFEKKNIDFIFQENPGIEMKCDAKKIQQVLLNLFLNAIAAMQEGGKLKVMLEKKAKQIIISVQDNGKGIPRSDINKIFDPFYTTKKEGTGMGLAVSREIIELHQGRLEVESSLNKGTVFKISLPLI